MRNIPSETFQMKAKIPATYFGAAFIDFFMQKKDEMRARQK